MSCGGDKLLNALTLSFQWMQFHFLNGFLHIDLISQGLFNCPNMCWCCDIMRGRMLCSCSTYERGSTDHSSDFYMNCYRKACEYVLNKDSCSLMTWIHCSQSPRLVQWKVTSPQRHRCCLVLLMYKTAKVRERKRHAPGKHVKTTQKRLRNTCLGLCITPSVCGFADVCCVEVLWDFFQSVTYDNHSLKSCCQK